ncbi:MAG: PQQ-binding-like beta-propeller repeat protein [Planctomycetes bacterium]|nr:PQQ-binding-like beta-propeller repeat protein [Planctomycetota bacterium]
MRAGVTSHHSFEWPQYGGNSEHRYVHRYRDRILAPKVLWFVPGLAGQPTLAGGELYSGGVTLARLEPLSGEVLDVAHSGSALRERVEGLATDFEWDGEAFPCLIGGAPAISRDLVIARDALDGGIVAFNRQLAWPAWEWRPNAPAPSARPGCLVGDDLFVFTSGTQVVALWVADGREAWRFDAGKGNELEMVPASDGRLVYLGTKGWFQAVEAATGETAWREPVGGNTKSCLLLADRAIVVTERVEEGAANSLRHGACALGLARGTQLWRTSFDESPSDPGLGSGGRLLWGVGGAIVLYSSESGKPEGARSSPDAADPADALGYAGSSAVTPLVPAGAVGNHRILSPTLVERSVVFGGSDGNLHVADALSGAVRWSFRMPLGFELQDFVHAGDLLFVATSLGLFCLGDARDQPPAAPGFVLEWSGEEGETAAMSLLKAFDR